jgi:hypothetical protein
MVGMDGDPSGQRSSAEKKEAPNRTTVTSGRRTPDDPIPSPVILYRLANHPWCACPLGVWLTSVLRTIRVRLIGRRTPQSVPLYVNRLVGRAWSTGFSLLVVLPLASYRIILDAPVSHATQHPAM